MARRKTKTKRSSNRSPARTSRTIVQVQAAPPTKRRKRSGGRRTVVHVSRRRRSVGSSLGSIGGALGGGRLPLLLGAAALGFAHKEGWLAKLPVIGKAGPITSTALLGWGAESLLKVKLPKIVHDAITSGLVISSFNLGFSGGQTIVGDEYAYPGGAVFFE